MFKTKVGYSTNKNAYDAGLEASQMVSKVGNVKLSMLFTNCEMDQSEVIKGVRSVLGTKPIIGCTSSGSIIVSDGVISGNSYAGIMSFADDNLIVGVACSEAGENAREIGKQIARDAITNAGIKKVPSYFYMVASPKEEEEYLKGIEDVIGIVPFFGGSAANNNVPGNWSIICNDKVFSDGCAVAFFYTKNECKNVFTGNYRETDKVGVITELANTRRLAKIDGEPALKKYAKWTNQNIDNLMGNKLLVSSILHPLGIKDPLGNITVVRHPLRGNDDYSMDIGNNLAVGTAVIKLETEIDTIIKTNSQALLKLNDKMKKDVTGYLLIQSSCRKLAVGKRLEEVYNEIINVLGDKEFLMVFTFGEYGSCEHSANMCGDLMLSFTAFSK